MWGLEEELVEEDEAGPSTSTHESHQKKADAQRKRKKRGEESAIQRETRQGADAQRKQNKRGEESEIQRETRQGGNRQQMQKSRGKESNMQRQTRQTIEAETKQRSRSKETATERQRRLAVDAEGKQQSRSKETATERQMRLAEKAEQMQKTRLEAKEVKKQTNRCALKFSDHMLQSNVGQMSLKCKHCGAWHFKGELLTGHANEFYQCCNYGKISVDKQNLYPNELKPLFGNKNFVENIRNYNSALAFASFGATLSPPAGTGPYCFRVHGQIYHQIGSLLPETNKSPSYSQLYIIDSEMATQERMKKPVNLHLKSDIVETFDKFLRQKSPFAEAYKKMYEVEREAESQAKQHNKLPPTTMMVFDINKNIDKRRYNIPACNEVAAIIVLAPGEQEPTPHSVAVHTRGGKLERLPTNSSLCDPMVYPVLFPYGEPGWHQEIPMLGKNQGCVTMCDFYSSKISVRDQWSPLFHAGKLFQQYLVDAFAKIETNRLDYPRYHQQELRVECYEGLSDYIQRRAEESHMLPGKRVVLPSSFAGSPRAMQQSYQDAMAICRKYGKPDIFLTFTCNPKWDEIQQHLALGQTASDRPDVVDRVFKLKLKELKDYLLEKDALGKVNAYCDVIEFQKRGLPHCHMLLILAEKDKLRTAEDIDMVVKAEIPDPVKYPNLHKSVATYMIHGPCGKLNKNCYCMELSEGEQEPRCSRHFPKEFQEETSANIDGFSAYRRKEDGFKIMKGTTAVGNEFVVPYNPHLTLKFNAHINVEHCASVKSFKYLYKYVYKGHDCAQVKVENAENVLNWDEIKVYADSRYISAPEAVWRINKFPMESKSHSISRLPVHLPHEQQVYFKLGQEKEAINRAKHEDTRLTAFFKLNDPSTANQPDSSYDPSAATVPYHEIPTDFFWNSDHNCWQKRQRRISVIGRMYTVSPKDAERYYLRLLLLHTPGAKSFKDLQTVNDEQCQTFHDAALKRGLLASDQEWRNCLSEGAFYKMPAELRQLFSTILLNCEPAEPKKLWEEFKIELSEDYIKKYGNTYAESYAYKDINELLQAQGKSMSDPEFQIPQPLQILESKESETVDTATLHSEGVKMVEKMNKEQRNAFNKIMYAATNAKSKQKLFFIDGPGGSGKTYLYIALYKLLTAKEKDVIMLAWSGIAANLLPQGQTVHSCFKLPLNLTGEVSCNVKPRTVEGKRIRDATAIFWDEAPMAPKNALEAIDLVLRDIMGNKKPFGGKVIILGGDFRQVLPVVRYASKMALLRTSIKSSKIWMNFEKIQLTKNMRAAPEEKQFAEWVLQLGNDELEKNETDEVKMPANCLTTEDLLDEVFGKQIDSKNSQKIAGRVILCPKNEDTLLINYAAVNRMSGIAKTYTSIDNVDCSNMEQDAQEFPQEFLYSLTPTGMPPHALTLKTGAVVILLRNLHIAGGLCNGTRMIIDQMAEHILDCKILTGQACGKHVLLPRITLAPNDALLPFTLKRRQFPIRLAFAMTIHKSQGQTFDKVGLLLRQPVFSHGQLYVACSRVRSFDSLRIKIDYAKKESDRTKNIVYREIL